MVNQEKVRLMTRAEWYRQEEERRALRINCYNKGSYVSMQIVKSLIIVTVGMVAAVALWLFMESERLMAVNDFDVLFELAEQIAVMYVAVLIAAALISWRSYSRIYVRSRSSVKKYYNILRKINHCNETERSRLTGQLPPVRKEGKTE